MKNLKLKLYQNILGHTRVSWGISAFGSKYFERCNTIKVKIY